MMKNNQCFWPYLRKSPAQIMATKVGITSQYMIWVPKSNQTNSTALSQVFPHKDLLRFISMFFFFDKKKHILPLYPAELVDIVQVYWETNTRRYAAVVCAPWMLTCARGVFAVWQRRITCHYLLCKDVCAIMSTLGEESPLTVLNVYIKH